MYQSLLVMLGLSLGLMFVHSACGQSDSGNSSKGNKPVYFAALNDITCECPGLARFPKTVRDAIAWLKKQDLAALPMGRTEIDGDRIYINIQEYETKTPDKTKMESHRKYIDIQLILAGEEYMGTVRLNESFPVSEAYNAEKDVMFFPESVMPFWGPQKDSPQRFLIKAGQFVIYTPDDIHVSGVFSDKPAKLKKLVVKCRVEDK